MRKGFGISISQCAGTLHDDWLPCDWDDYLTRRSEKNLRYPTYVLKVT